MSTLAQGREAYAARRWPDAVGQYTAADQDAELPAGDLEQLATSVILTGRASEGVDIQARAHLKYLADGDYPAAGRCAFWTGMNLMLMGEPARGAAQQNLVFFSGQCQMHRAELYRLHGAWAEALDAAKSAQDLAFQGDRMATYGGFYQEAEVHRLRGDFGAAEAAYLKAQETGFPPQPGLALLRLAQGRPDQARTLLRQALDGAGPDYRRLMLAAAVEIELAAGDASAARSAMEELASLCASIDMPMLHALAEQSEAAVLFHEGDPQAALVTLRRAWSRWLSLDAPFEAARCQALVARLCAALGDEESARLEREAARAVFSELGAAPALSELEQSAQEQPAPVAPGARTVPAPAAGNDAGHSPDAGPLTARETEVIRLLADGLSNRDIAVELFISEKTVARHLSNIFTKLGLTSRSAATAYAYRHGLA